MRPILIALTVSLSFVFVGCSPRENSALDTAGPKEHSVHVQNLKDDTFSAATASGIAVVDFWAAWCGPCRTQGPIIDDLAESAHTMATIAKVDVDQAPKLSEQFNVESIPMILVLKDGKVLNRFVGVTSKKELMAAIEAAQ